MIVTADQINDYSRSIKAIQRGASNLMYETLEPVWGMDGTRMRSSLEKAVRETAPSIARRYGQAAGEVSAELWEDIYGNDTGEREEALLPDIDIDGRFADRAVNAVSTRFEEKDKDAAAAFLASFVTKAVADTARQTQTYNTRRVYKKRLKGWDKARFARIPQGDKTCAFCMMLASRGFVYISQESAGGDEWHGTDMDHYHAYCDCLVVSAFSNDAAVEGYDPTELYRMYQGAITRYNGDGPIDLEGTLANMRKMYGMH